MPTGTKMTEELFLQLLSEQRPNIIFLDIFDDYTAYKKFKNTDLNYEFYARCNSILRKHYGQWHTLGIPRKGETKKYKYTDEEFEKVVNLKSPNIMLLDKRSEVGAKIHIKCKIDGYEWETPCADLVRGKGCPVCTGKRVLKGVNDIVTTAPWMLNYYNEDFCYSHTKSSLKKGLATCPVCKTQKFIAPACLGKQGLGCQSCGDGISYPNKFASALLKQLPIENYCQEYSPEWIGKKRYDHYFEYLGEKYILEMDGQQHKRNKGKTLNWNSLQMVKENDKYKETMAIEHHIKVIRIDCDRATHSYIKNNILKSELNGIFDLSNVDWSLCEKYAVTNRIKEVCEYYSSHPDMTSYDLSKNLGIAPDIIVGYLERGNLLGLCPKYDSNKIKEIVKEKIFKKNAYIVWFKDIETDEEKVIQGFGNVAKYLNDKYPDRKYVRDSIAAGCREHDIYTYKNIKFKVLKKGD